jgi:hypothetical protein
MNPAQIDSRITESFERTRPYVPLLVQRLAITYGIPMFSALLIATIGGRLLLALLPEFPLSTANIAILLINLVVLVRGYAWLEQRYGGTKLFFLYNVVSRNRRELKRLMAQSPVDSAAVSKLLQQLQISEQDFVGAAGPMAQSA